jgi:hypothetical protein
MYALEMDEEEIEDHMHSLLIDSNGNGSSNGKVAVVAM